MTVERSRLRSGRLRFFSIRGSRWAPRPDAARARGQPTFEPKDRSIASSASIATTAHGTVGPTAKAA